MVSQHAEVGAVGVVSVWQCGKSSQSVGRPVLSSGGMLVQWSAHRTSCGELPLALHWCDWGRAATGSAACYSWTDVGLQDLG
jgi:hypothetical protein